MRAAPLVRLAMKLIVFGMLGVALRTGPTKKAEAGQYDLMGVGAQSCGTWTAQRQGGYAAKEMAWVLGFLSGVGFTGIDGANPLRGMDAQGVWAWIDNYCRDHPIDNISGATAAFFYVHPR
jgi:hypothetical protein